VLMRFSSGSCGLHRQVDAADAHPHAAMACPMAYFTSGRRAPNVRRRQRHQRLAAPQAQDFGTQFIGLRIMRQGRWAKRSPARLPPSSRLYHLAGRRIKRGMHALAFRHAGNQLGAGTGNLAQRADQLGAYQASSGTSCRYCVKPVMR